MKNLIDIILIQESMSNDVKKNLNKLLAAISKVIVKNTTIVVLHELSYLRYIAISKDSKNKLLAININSDIIKRVCKLSISKKIYILFPFYEISRGKFYNTSIIISPQGKILSKYRKRNIPNEICYEEDYYFCSSDNKHSIVNINGYNIGLMTCWDQWYSNSYYELSKRNVDLILCPTSIGHAYYNQKNISIKDEKKKWVNTIVANSLMINTPVVIANRVGKEFKGNKSIKFWGSSFITNANGDISFQITNKKIIHKHTINLSSKQKYQKAWGFK